MIQVGDTLPDAQIFERGGLAHSDSLLRFLSGTSEAIMLPI
ncbi:MAG: hypothetical protein GAK40_00467 [Burkholderia plantarii]|nr:MAG: hypothetical protein GAK40_00467 [Burkholderia plantarii]